MEPSGNQFSNKCPIELTTKSKIDTMVVLKFYSNVRLVVKVKKIILDYYISSYAIYITLLDKSNQSEDLLGPLMLQ